MFANVIPVQRMPRHSSTFTYAVPEDLQAHLQPGMLVRVPWRRRWVQAMVHSVSDVSEHPSPSELSTFLEDKPVWNQAQLDALQQHASEQYASLGTLCHALLPEKPRRKATNPVTPPAAPAAFHPPVLSRAVIPELAKLESLDAPFLAIRLQRMADRHYLYRQWVRQVPGQVLILVPQHLDALELQQSLQNALKLPVAVWGEQIGKNERWQLFSDIHKGRYRIVVATRSGALLPLHDLGLIIIDQEDRQDHRSWEGHPYFDARDLARDLASRLNIPVRETSFHPRLSRLAVTSYAQTPLISAPITTFFYRNSAELLHPQLSERISGAINDGSDVLCICTKKAAHAGLACLDCQHTWSCPSCSSRLYEADARLQCPSCDYVMDDPASCPRCGGSNIRGFLPGAQTIAKKIAQTLSVPTVLFSSQDQSLDPHMPPAVIISTPFTWRRLVADGKRHIGCVLLFHPESVLYTPDYRANEWYVQFVQWHRHMAHSYMRQPLLIQTGLTEHSELHAAAVDADQTNSALKELDMRKHLGLPPFGHILLIRLKSADADETQEIDASMRRDLPNVRIHGPKPTTDKNEQQWTVFTEQPVLDKFTDSVYSKLLIYRNPETPLR